VKENREMIVTLKTLQGLWKSLDDHILIHIMDIIVERDGLYYSEQEQDWYPYSNVNNGNFRIKKDGCHYEFIIKAMYYQIIRGRGEFRTIINKLNQRVYGRAESNNRAPLFIYHESKPSNVFESVMPKHPGKIVFRSNSNKGHSNIFMPGNQSRDIVFGGVILLSNEKEINEYVSKYSKYFGNL
jgi:hypothetical protein